MVCPFEDEVYEVADRLKAQGDVQIIREKDYIKNPKKNGYKSLHMIVEVPIYSSKGPLKEKVEIQLRTVQWITGLCLSTSYFIRRQR